MDTETPKPRRIVTLESPSEFYTKDPLGLREIITFIETPNGRFEYMRKDGGSMAITRFENDELDIKLKGACFGCKLTEGTIRHITSVIESNYVPVKVRVSIAEAKPVNAAQLKL